ncbi:putative Ubiquitin-conjugating enzyme E2 J1 [Paratrimastix pyriformis]|uniref:Ubiquitin-conjugating enzyme E2 J1 n=1 Tax=Paratrimastix pyriformis TaxID=342808 RepID=A0ABQ8UHY7_9EUKA|nr:putative Ubiquitin-conjugating enzyme E2 J1 [Paratrimastix pyriformis]
MDKRWNVNNPAIKRILQEARELAKDDSNTMWAAPLEDDIFEWHFTIRGPPDSEFSDGLYHGRILLPSQYPFAPPDLIFLTPNGRFEVGKKICLSLTAFHPESWRPGWGIRSILCALISFLPTPGEGAVGAIDFPADVRRRLALESQAYTCPVCNVDHHTYGPPPPPPSSSATTTTTTTTATPAAATTTCIVAPTPTTTTATTAVPPVLSTTVPVATATEATPPAASASPSGHSSPSAAALSPPGGASSPASSTARSPLEEPLVPQPPTPEPATDSLGAPPAPAPAPGPSSPPEAVLTRRAGAPTQALPPPAVVPGGAAAARDEPVIPAGVLFAVPVACSVLFLILLVSWVYLRLY